MGKNPMKKDKVEDQVNSANENPSVNPGGQLIKKTNDAVKEIITSGEQLIKKIKSSLKPSGNRSSSVAVKGNQDQMKIATGELDKRSKEIIKEIKEMVNTFVPLSFIEKKVENISFLFVNSGNEVKENVGTLVAKIKEDFQDFKKAVEKFVDVVKKVGTLAAPTNDDVKVIIMEAQKLKTAAKNLLMVLKQLNSFSYLQLRLVPR